MPNILSLAPETFVIPDADDRFFLFAPLQDRLCSVNAAGLQALRSAVDGVQPDNQHADFLCQMRQLGFLVTDQDGGQLPRQRGIPPRAPYQPTQVTLMPTLRCHLRCVYCYADAGETTEPDMTTEVARAAVDTVIHNAVTTGASQVGLSFHGGGEPLLGSTLPLISATVEYFRAEANRPGLKHSVSVATNGVYLGRHKPFAWLKATFNRVNLSFDGPQDIHDAQRLKPDGQGSFEEVMEALRGLEAHGLSYGLRTTITRLGVGRMSEVVEFFHSVSSARTFHLEPLFECGRCRRTMTKAPSPADYIVNALAAQRLAARLGVKLHYSRSRLESVSDTSCGAAGRDLFVAPAGRATTCLEVCRDDDPRGAVFLVGAYQGASGAFVWDMRALGRLRRRVVGRVPHCRDCFAKYSGAGDCLARVAAQSGSMFRASGNQRCDINRALLLDEMRQREPSEGKKGDEETD